MSSHQAFSRRTICHVQYSITCGRAGVTRAPTFNIWDFVPSLFVRAGQGRQADGVEWVGRGMRRAALACHERGHTLDRIGDSTFGRGIAVSDSVSARDRPDVSDPPHSQHAPAATRTCNHPPPGRPVRTEKRGLEGGLQRKEG